MFGLHREVIGRHLASIGSHSFVLFAGEGFVREVAEDLSRIRRGSLAGERSGAGA